MSQVIELIDTLTVDGNSKVFARKSPNESILIGNAVATEGNDGFGGTVAGSAQLQYCADPKFDADGAGNADWENTADSALTEKGEIVLSDSGGGWEYRIVLSGATGAVNLPIYRSYIKR